MAFMRILTFLSNTQRRAVSLQQLNLLSAFWLNYDGIRRKHLPSMPPKMASKKNSASGQWLEECWLRKKYKVELKIQSCVYLSPKWRIEWDLITDSRLVLQLPSDNIYQWKRQNYPGGKGRDCMHRIARSAFRKNKHNTARCYAYRGYAVARCLSIRPSHAVLSQKG